MWEAGLRPARRRAAPPFVSPDQEEPAEDNAVTP